jgi:hypothetical protein
MRLPNAVVAMAAAGLMCLVPVTSSVAAGHVSPKPGNYQGQVSSSKGPVPMTLTVTKHHTIKDVGATAQTKAGCKANKTGFEVPGGPIKIDASGHFSASSTFYAGPKVKVTVRGTFTSKTTVHGHLVVDYKKVKGCDATHSFIAKWSH